MDYRTKPTSRKRIRSYAKYLRKIFGVPMTGPMPVLEILDKISDVFDGSNYEIVEDDELPARTMAQCSENEYGGYTIQIKESVYEGAYQDKKGAGACRGYIFHEICHVFLFYIGYKPIYAYSLKDDSIPAFCSVEWQAKALCGETMIPFEESIGMTKSEIVEKYNVSKGFAKEKKRIERLEDTR